MFTLLTDPSTCSNSCLVCQEVSHLGFRASLKEHFRTSIRLSKKFVPVYPTTSMEKPKLLGQPKHRNSLEFPLTPFSYLCFVLTWADTQPGEALLTTSTKILGLRSSSSSPTWCSLKPLCLPDLPSWSSIFLRNHILYLQVPA